MLPITQHSLYRPRPPPHPPEHNHSLSFSTSPSHLTPRPKPLPTVDDPHSILNFTDFGAWTSDENEIENNIVRAAPLSNSLSNDSASIVSRQKPLSKQEDKPFIFSNPITTISQQSNHNHTSILSLPSLDTPFLPSCSFPLSLSNNNNDTKRRRRSYSKGEKTTNNISDDTLAQSDCSMSTLPQLKQEEELTNNNSNTHCISRTPSPSLPSSPKDSDPSFSLALGILETMKAPMPSSDSRQQRQECSKSILSPSKKKKLSVGRRDKAHQEVQPTPGIVKRRKSRRMRHIAITLGKTWTYFEDEILCDIFTRVSRSEQRRIIKMRLPNRSFEEARARWFGELGPFVLGRPWTQEEIGRVDDIEDIIGNREVGWVVAAREFKGRSVHALMNRWDSTKRETNMAQTSTVGS